jgi:hypothetical protein
VISPLALLIGFLECLDKGDAPLGLFQLWRIAVA